MRRALALLGLAAALLAGSACSDDGSTGGGASGSGGTSSGGTSAGGSTSGGASGGGTTSGGASGATSGGSAGVAGTPSGGGTSSGGSAGASGGAAGAPADAGGDAGVPLPGLGAIAGDCGPIDPTEILSAAPYSFETSLDFGTAGYDYDALSVGGKVHDDGNLGGSSIQFEVSYEVLYRCELATLLKTEPRLATPTRAARRRTCWSPSTATSSA
ncbi:MAG: hypothetical protein U0263_39700 [Polyangiaceae bacterium]